MVPTTTTMKIFALALMISLLSEVHGWMEFGRERTMDDKFLQRKRLVSPTNIIENDEAGTDLRERQTQKFLDESLEDVIDARSVLEISLSMSMSMSMGIMPSAPTVPTANPPVPTANPPSQIPPSGPPGPTLPSAPTPPSVSSMPVASPSSTSGPVSEPTFSYEPSTTAFPSPAPSSSPSASPTTSPSVSYEPSTTNSPTTVLEGSTDCVIENGLSLGSSSDTSSTPLFLAVGYQAESTSSVVDDFQRELENELIGTAVAAILGCEADFTGSIFPQTLEVATCTSSLDEAEGCFIMETEAIVFVKGPVNEDVAIFEAYQAIQNGMISGRFVGLIPTILRLQFLSPLPLPVPPGSGEDTSEPIPVSSNRDSSGNVNPWTIGASVASIMGGFVSILVWARARKFRQRRQQLTDETSWVNGNSPAE